MARPTASLARFCLALCATLAAAFGVPAGAATIANLYQSTVPQAGRGEPAQSAAFQDALRDVLVRVTGQRDAPSNAALAPLVADARRYVQTFRPAPGGQVTVSFDGNAIENAVAASGLPLWGRERPTVLVWLAVDRGSQRLLIAAGAPGDERRAVERAAAQRGLVLAWPSLGGLEDRDARLADILTDQFAPLSAAAERYGADSVLVGRAVAGAGGALAVNWTFLAGAEPATVQGLFADGVHLAADRYAATEASTAAARLSDVSMTVSGIGDAAAYAAAVRTLESLSVVRGVAVGEAFRDVLTLRVTLRGDAAVLRRAVVSNGRFEPQEASGGALAFRWRP